MTMKNFSNHTPFVQRKAQANPHSRIYMAVESGSEFDFAEAFTAREFLDKFEGRGFSEHAPFNQLWPTHSHCIRTDDGHVAAIEIHIDTV